MNQLDLIKAVRADTELTHDVVTRAMQAFKENAKKALARGEVVRLIGFGTFSVYRSGPRKGRNAGTGEIIHIPAKNRVRFSQSSKLKV